MYRDKRAMIYMHDQNLQKIEKGGRVVTVLHNFMSEVALRVNHLLMAEEIDIELYAQDEFDRRQTQLYGINEEMSAREQESCSPI